MLIKGLKIFKENEVIDKGYIEISGGKIKDIGEQCQIKDNETISFPETYKCLPGMIDVHIHGANGSDTMDATPHALENIAQTLPKEGTTSFLATTITQEHSAIERALENAGKYINDQPDGGQAEVVGIHLEGPFINPEKAGAQPLEYIIEGDISLFKKWQDMSNGNIRLVTLAPERKNGLALIKYLSENQVTASIGHSNGTYHDVDQAIKAGATHVTHLYNGMKGLHHREPGVLGAALLRHELYAEMIVDGLHICPEMVDLAYRQKGSDRTVLITDAMRAKCMKNGIYDLGGQDVRVEDGKATLANGSLAGSVLEMKQAIKNILAYTDATLVDVMKMGAVNPAIQCGVFDRKGSVEINKDADLIILDENNDLVMTICRGAIAYQR
ncbi:N-acetylglucosamine-6-phosphate deacetylase [Scopulibacillus daqui]|uniref:N-acetylglucosamine-6-phosphate deacetylase n=1 Tax=Scopulibacillus daqui TaxID=1469162 RepID=A0ABS2Q2N5_9BACL|nr:N-acetylglucosamine-6-phosphate deacetylase [Scopulibacillus daqui]MBM7646550.1 N-acetylglucosamine-6-phosphate deacetylase [Scopulibacillus daqui]